MAAFGKQPDPRRACTASGAPEILRNLPPAFRSLAGGGIPAQGGANALTSARVHRQVADTSGEGAAEEAAPADDLHPGIRRWDCPGVDRIAWLVGPACVRKSIAILHGLELPAH